MLTQNLELKTHNSQRGTLLAQQQQNEYIDPQTATEHIRFIPLGGLNEVGKNVAAVEYGEDIIIIDLGMGFPEEEMLGVDLVLPDISYLASRQSRIRGICITHGHEDHIGGIPWLLPQVSAPIYGTPLTLGLISNELRERGMLGEADPNQVQAGDVV